MRSKAEIIRSELVGMSVLDIGGMGYGESNPYEDELVRAWSVCSKRVSADFSSNADISVDFNTLPIKACLEAFDVATAFDVLEHLEHPVEVLRWIPCPRLIVTLPNALSFIARRMEEKNRSKHLYSFTPYTASILLGEGGWGVERVEFQFGKWSLHARVINAIGSIAPSRIGTGIVLHCSRSAEKMRWNFK